MGPAGSCRLLAALAAIQSAAAALAPDTHEFDLVFPRAGGRYALATEDGGALPVVLAVQNPDSAYHYGFQFWWDVYEQPHREDFWNHSPRFAIRAGLGDNDTTFPADSTHLATAATDALKAGATYTFHWRLRTGPWCEYLPGSAEYRHSHEMANGSFEFAVEAGAAAPTFTGTCPSALGVAAFASTTVYRGLPFWGDEHGDPATQTLSCGVMANATTKTTAAPEPCGATVDAAQEASISSVMQWGSFATATATQTGAPSSGRIGVVVSWPLAFLSTAVIWGII